MPFIDLNKLQPGKPDIPHADITIIGAGTAGILLAVMLTQKGKKVLIIESGAFGENEEKQKLNTVQQSGKKVRNAEWGRKRAIGGTTIVWGGQSLPFTKLDFEKREWVPESGWPISFQELDAYYKKANAFMGIDTLNYDSDIFPKINLKDPGIDSSIFDLHISKWADEPNFYLLHKTFLEENVNVLYNANVVGIYKNNNVTDTIAVANFSKEMFTIPIKKLIFAAGTIETVRLLLNNKIGNRSGLLGKYFMEHPCIEVGTIKPRNLYNLQRLFNTHIWNGKKYSVRLSLHSRLQADNKLLNCSAGIMFLAAEGAYTLFYSELKSLKKHFRLQHLIKLAGFSKSIFKIVWAYLYDKFYYKPNAITILSLMIEQEPLAESFIGVSDHKDEFDCKQSLLNWEITYASWQTAVAFAAVLKKEIERLHLGKVNLYPHIRPEEKDWSTYLTDVCHHMGGCRMSDTPYEGVVDKNLKLWDEDNLYVCSQAVFPTASHSNPALTMLALGARLADHLAN